MLTDMCLPKFDIYQVTIALNCCKRHTNSLCDVWSEIHLVRHNIASAGQYAWALKKYIQACVLTLPFS